MLHMKFRPKTGHYCNWQSIVTSVNNHLSACYSEIKACSQIAPVLDLF